MGVFLAPPVHSKAFRGLPHARGGVSTTMIALTVMLVSSPRTWGCFFRAVPCAKPQYRLPHARGGVSKATEALKRVQESSPRTWGCFLLSFFTTLLWMVFPTHVGVFHARGGLVRFWHCLPHARGGAPSRGCPPKAPSSRLGLFTSTLDIDSFIWREWQKGRRTCLNIF